ncbi:probable WRKY transcription factor 70 [Neltuma alba]|nr:probable WRKY transcription factor 70 [Prosopis alba]
MSGSVMENLAMKELERGRELANQLRRLIFRSEDGEDDHKTKGLTTSSAEDLAAKVLDSFANTLSLFNSNRHVSADPSLSSFCPLPAHSGDSQESSKTRSTSTTIKDPTRCTPKKRKSSAQTWEEDTKMGPKEDGHAWRKYGQKTILDSKHPRNYFRCTHKYDQGCEATKQVQKIQDDPPLYRTTYFGHHTCTNLLNPQAFLDSHDDLNSTSAFILSFNNNIITTTFDQKLKINNDSCSLFPSAGSSVKNEDDQHCHISNIVKQEKNNYNDNVNVVPSCSSNNDCCLVFRDEEEAVLPFGFGGDEVDALNSAVLYDPLVFEDPFLFQMI